MQKSKFLPTKNCPFQRKGPPFSETSKSTQPSASTQGIIQVAIFSFRTTPSESFVLNLETKYLIFLFQIIQSCLSVVSIEQFCYILSNNLVNLEQSISISNMGTFKFEDQ